MTDTPDLLGRLYGVLDNLITRQTSSCFDDGVLAAQELLDGLPRDLQPYDEVQGKLDHRITDLLLSGYADYDVGFNDGVGAASVAVAKFFRELEAAPKWYIAEPFQLGADVQDGYEGRTRPSGEWLSASGCRGYHDLVFETRPVPKEETYLISLPESTVRYYGETTFTNGSSWSDQAAVVAEACRHALRTES